ncbi:MAG: alpha/beta hydrolase [Ruminococcaceae bacterium]|nr:alpha/beta hydrolase [Oscillospiraceae bacterium]
MEIKTFQLREDNPDVRLVVYINAMFPTLSIQKRPMMLVIPGGGYHCCSEREAEPIARAYMAHGYNAAVLYYSLSKNAVNKNPLEDACRAMTILRRNAEEWNTDPDRIAAIGFSAGGHLTGWLGTMWHDEEISQRVGLKYREEARPNAIVLCYPVITSGEKAHKGSFYNILGTQTPSEEQLELYSLEKRVTDETPPAFLWHTASDTCVPVENSLYMAAALSAHKIPFELHVFPNGPHGMGLANDEVMAEANPYVMRWHELSVKWLNKTFNNTL